MTTKNPHSRILVIACVFFIGAKAHAVPPQYYVDFESGDLSQEVWREVWPDAANGGTAEVSIVSDFARAGDYSLRSYLAHGDVRSEVKQQYHVRADVGGEHWYGWSIYIPSDFGADGRFDIVTQWHDYHNNQPQWSKTGQAPTNININNNEDRLQMDLKYQDAVQSATHAYFPLGDYVKGAWNDLVMHVKWTHDPVEGFMKIWVNGVLRMDYNGPTYMDYGPGNGPYFKMGNYKGDGNWGGTSPRVFYFDEFRMGDEYASYEEVAPPTSSLLIHEPFDYPAGETIDTKFGGHGWTSPWTHIASFSGDAPHHASDVAQSHFPANDETYALLDGTHSWLSRSTSAYGDNEDGTTIWISVRAAYKDDKWTFFPLRLRDNGTDVFTIKSPSNTTYVVDLDDVGTTAGDISLGVGSPNDDNRHFVARIDFHTGNEDIHLFSFPTLPGTEPNIADALVSISNTDLQFDEIGFGYRWGWGSATVGIVDDLRVASDYAGLLEQTVQVSEIEPAYESFDYTVNSVLTDSSGGHNGSYGWGSEWLYQGSFSGDLPHHISNNAVTYFPYETGHYLKLDGIHSWAYRALKNRLGDDENGKTVWLAVYAGYKNWQWEFFPLRLQDSIYDVFTLFSDTNSPYSVDLDSLSSTGNAIDLQIGAAVDDYRAFLLRIDFKNGDDELHLFSYPELPASEPAISEALLSVYNRDIYFDGLGVGYAWAWGHVTKGIVDEIRMAATYDDLLQMAPIAGMQDVTIAHEGFDYTNGQPVSGRNGGFGWSGAWLDQASFSGDAPHHISSLPRNYLPVASGNYANLDGIHHWNYRLLTETLGDDEDGTTLWLRVHAAYKSWQWDFFPLRLRDASTDRLIIKSKSYEGYSIDFDSINTTDSDNALGVGGSLDDFRQFLIRIDLKPGNDDIHVFSYTDLPETEPGPGQAIFSAFDQNIQFDRVGFGYRWGWGTSTQGVVDDITIATSYEQILANSPY